MPTPDPAEAGRPRHALFGTLVPPDQAVLHGGWRAILDPVDQAIRQGGLVALTGPAGIGKTLFLQVLELRLRAAGLSPVLLRAGQEPDAGTPDVILIDDADRLSPSILGALARHGRPIVVAGPAQLVDVLRRTGLAVEAVAMEPLRPEAAREFLAMQISRGGQPSGLIESAAITELVEAAQGVPRQLQLLAGLSVFLARLAASPTVTRAHVEQASLMQGGEPDDDDADSEDELLGMEPVPQSGPAPWTAARPTPGRPEASRGASAAAWRTGSRWAGLLVLAALGAGGLAYRGLVPMPEPAATPRVVAQDAPEPAPRQAAAVPMPVPVPASPSLPALPLPPVQPVHVALTYDPANPAGFRWASSLAVDLRHRGYAVGTPEPASVRERDAVYYYFAEDAAAAAALARSVDREAVQLRVAAPPRPGTMRVVSNPRPGPMPRPQQGASR